MRRLLCGLAMVFTLLPLSLQADNCGIDWDVISPKFETGYQTAVIYANNQFLSVGGSRVLRSFNGIDWTSHVNNANLTDVIWLNNRYLGSSRQGIWTSDDGLNWTRSAEEVLAAKLATNGQTVVTHDIAWNGNIWYSTDQGNAWMQQSLGEGIHLRSVLWDGQQFVLEGIEQNQTFFWISTDGISWEKLTINNFNRLDHLIFNGTHYLALGYRVTEHGQFLVRSENLVDWEILQRRGFSLDNLSSLSWIDGRYMATSTSGNHFETSTDGINWSSHAIKGNFFYIFSEFATDGQTYVAAVYGAGLISSDNLIDWYSVSKIAPHLADVAASPERFVAVSRSNNSELLTSIDGYNWVSLAFEPDRQINGVEWFKDRFWAWEHGTTQNTPNIYSSQNGTVWTSYELNNDELSDLLINSEAKVVSSPNHLIMFEPQYGRRNFAISDDGINWQSVTLNAPTENSVMLNDGIWDGTQFVFTVLTYTNQIPPETKLLIATSVDGQQWQFREVETNAKLAGAIYSNRPSIATNGDIYVLSISHEKDSAYGVDPALYTSTDLDNWVLQQPKIAPYVHTNSNVTYVNYTELYWTGHEFLLSGDINLRSKEGITWQPVIAPNMRSVASNGNALVGVRDTTLAVSQCQADTQPLAAVGSPITETLHIRALINVHNQYQRFPYIEARWRQGGEATTARGDRVIWGYFYADSQEVSWGSPDNPELFVKIWFDVSGRIDVNYFHVSVPSIDVYTSFNGHLNEPDQYSITNTTDRYVRHYLLPDGRSDHEIRQEDGISAEMPIIPASTPNVYQILEAFRAEDRLQIGAQIETETTGTLDGLWFSGGEAETSRGDLVAWGYFYADPQEVDWGDRNNPEVFVKVWFDVNGRIDTNYFHVSVPNINLFSNYTKQGHSEQRYGLTHTEDRYTRHEFWQN